MSATQQGGAEQEQEQEQAGRWRRISAAALPVYNVDGQAMLAEYGAPGRARVAVISVPRSGTHFTSELLKGLGFLYGGLHASPEMEPDVVQDRRSWRLAPDGALVWQTYNLPLADVVSLLGPGQFIQGHIPYQPEAVAALKDCKLIFLKRNLRNVAVSAMRFIARLRAGGVPYPAHYNMQWCELEDGPARMSGYLRMFGGGLRDMLRTMAPWAAQDNAFVLDFDILNGGDGQAALDCVQALAAFLGSPVDAATARAAMLAAIGRDTVSWTGKLSDWRSLWSDEVEQVFAHFVLDENAYFLMPDRLVPGPPGAAPWQAPQAVQAWLDGGVLHAVEVAAGLPTLADGSMVLALEQYGAHFAVNVGEMRWDQGFLLFSTGSGGDHKHVSVELWLGDGPVTLSFMAQTAADAPCLMAQIGGAAGYFNSYIDCGGMHVIRMESSGHYHGIGTHLERQASGMLKITVSGYLDGEVPGDCYARIYLCGAGGALEFERPAVLTLSDLTLARAPLQRAPEFF